MFMLVFGCQFLDYLAFLMEVILTNFICPNHSVVGDSIPPQAGGVGTACTSRGVWGQHVPAEGMGTIHLHKQGVWGSMPPQGSMPSQGSMYQQGVWGQYASTGQHAST